MKSRREQKNGQGRVVSVAPVPQCASHLRGISSPDSPSSQEISVQSAATDGITTQAERSKLLVQQGLQLLFHCEYLVLVEYVECIVPLVFVVYKSILEQLPNIPEAQETGVRVT